jgi:hypothetical protein
MTGEWMIDMSDNRRGGSRGADGDRNGRRDNRSGGRPGGESGRSSGASTGRDGRGGSDRSGVKDGRPPAGRPQRDGGRPSGDRRQRDRGGSDGGSGPRPERRAGERDRPRPERRAGARDANGWRNDRTDRRRDGLDAHGSARPVDPELDPEITGHELGEDVIAELGSLSSGLAMTVAKHLVMAGQLVDEDPELAYEHALAARRRSARVGLIREAVGVTAYSAGKFAEALSDLRAARRITGSAEYLPMMADCERGLGRPRRALDLAADPAVAGLDTPNRIEMLIVAAGARRDLGDVDAAVVSLQVPELRSKANVPWVTRLRYAYADLLAAAGRTGEARRWFVRAAEADVDGETDAAERAREFDAE